jgi:hypothetical protein
MIIASDSVPGGIDPICKGGFIFSPLQLYFIGISSHSENAGLDIVRLFIFFFLMKKPGHTKLLSGNRLL